MAAFVTSSHLKTRIATTQTSCLLHPTHEKTPASTRDTGAEVIGSTNARQMIHRGVGSTMQAEIQILDAPRASVAPTFDSINLIPALVYECARKLARHLHLPKTRTKSSEFTKKGG